MAVCSFGMAPGCWTQLTSSQMPWIWARNWLPYFVFYLAVSSFWPVSLALLAWPSSPRKC